MPPSTRATRLFIASTVPSAVFRPRALHRCRHAVHPLLYVDIGATFELKMDKCSCHRSQHQYPPSITARHLRAGRGGSVHGGRMRRRVCRAVRAGAPLQSDRSPSSNWLSSSLWAAPAGRGRMNESAICRWAGPDLSCCRTWTRMRDYVRQIRVKSPAVSRTTIPTLRLR